MATEIGPFPLPKRMAFRCDDEHKLIAIADIEAPPPKERVRVLRILEAIRDNTHLRPILLKYLVNGEHRYWCSRAVGFDLVPATIIEYQYPIGPDHRARTNSQT
jgi:hypothetical protein